MIVYAVAPFVEVFVCALVGVCVTAMQFSLFGFMVESPYYLLVKGEREAAQASLRWLRRRVDVEEELRAISEAVERQQSERGKPQDLVLIGSNRKAAVILTVLNAAQHFCGVTVMLMNLQSILADAQSVFLSETTTAILFALLMLVFSLVSVALVDRFGRKILLTTSSLLTAASLLLLAIYFTLKNLTQVDTQPLSWIPTFAVMFYAAVYRFGLGMVPIILTGELFPTSVKAMGVTYADAVYVVFASVVLFMHGAFGRAFGLHVPFYIYSVACFATAVFCGIYVPETRGKTLEEIQILLKGGEIEMRES